MSDATRVHIFDCPICGVHRIQDDPPRRVKTLIVPGAEADPEVQPGLFQSICSQCVVEYPNVTTLVYA